MLHTRLFRITTPKTDLFRRRGYKFADSSAQLVRLMDKLTVVNVEVKDSGISGNICYKTVNEVDLACIKIAEAEGVTNG